MLDLSQMEYSVSLAIYISLYTEVTKHTSTSKTTYDTILYGISYTSKVLEGKCYFKYFYRLCVIIYVRSTVIYVLKAYPYGTDNYIISKGVVSHKVYYSTNSIITIAISCSV